MTNFFTLQYLLYWLIIFSFFTTPIFSQPTSRIAPTIKEWAQSMFMPSKKQHLIPEFEDSYGVVFRDLNNDGLPDLYVVRFRELNRLFLNQGDEQLVMDYTIPSGLGGNLMARKEENLELGASAVDFNNDGAQDVLIVGWGLTTYLFHQSGRLNFPENTPLAIEHFPLDGNCGVWADIDRDGDLDLFITDEHYPNHLFINKDGYGFSEQASQFGLDLNAVSQGAVFADFNNDDYPDLYVCNWFAPDVFYRNVQGKSFQAVNIPIYHLQENVNSNGVSAGDVDNDGDLDLLVTDRNGTSKLYLNKTPRGGEEFRFEESPTTHFPGNPYPAYGSIIADFNNDGSQDIYISNIGPNLFLLNNGHGGFQISYKDSMATLSSNRYYSTGSAVADYDLDGDLDLFVANKDTLSQLLINPLTNRSSIRFVLEGVLSNRDAIGSKIWLYLTFPGDSTVLVGFQEISGGSGYLSMNEPIAHFGTVERGIYSARIRFPSGREIQLDDLRPGSVYFVSEVKGIQKTLIRFWQSIRRIVHGRNFWVNLLLFLGLLGLISSFLWMATQRYQWQNRQLVYFLIVTFFISYGVFAILSSTSLKNILLVQFGIFTGGIAVLVVFLEKLLRIEQQRYGYRQLLRQFSEELIFIKNNTELYQKMVEIIQKALEVDFCLAMEIQGNKGVFIAHTGELKIEQSTIHISDELKHVLTSQRIFSGGDIQTLPLPAVITSVELCLSLSRDGKLLGVLLMGKRRERNGFRQEDLDLLQILAGQAAIAIENNLYIEESKKLIQKLTEAELRERYVAELEEKNQTLQKLYRELQDAQTQLIQSEKMASLGQLVAGVAHELNNPISFIYANMKQLQSYIEAIEALLNLISEFTDRKVTIEEFHTAFNRLNEQYDLTFIQEDINSLISESMEGSKRVKEVVQNLRNFSRLDEAEWKTANLHEGLDSTLMLLANEMKNRITVHKEYGQIPEIYCNPGQLNQVFMNLLLNACQAIEKKGDIWIRTRSTGKHVEIEIEDNGKGMPVEIQNRIFDPFFTTKPVGSGTGLGLSISYKIIEQHGGRLTFTSTPGKGTCFKISLPIHGVQPQD